MSNLRIVNHPIAQAMARINTWATTKSCTRTGAVVGTSGTAQISP
jgi:hypothetical protein